MDNDELKKLIDDSINTIINEHFKPKWYQRIECIVTLILFINFVAYTWCSYIFKIIEFNGYIFSISLLLSLFVFGCTKPKQITQIESIENSLGKNFKINISNGIIEIKTPFTYPDKKQIVLYVDQEFNITNRFTINQNALNKVKIAFQGIDEIKISDNNKLILKSNKQKVFFDVYQYIQIALMISVS